MTDVEMAKLLGDEIGERMAKRGLVVLTAVEAVNIAYECINNLRNSGVFRDTDDLPQAAR